MDFAQLDLAAASEKGADCHLEHPVSGELLYTADGKPITIRVVGQDSREFRAAVASVSERAGKGKPSLDKAEANGIEILSKLVTAWHGIQWDGKPLECTPENVRMFLSKFPPIRAQLDAFIADRSNFFRTTGKK
ncbi:MAG: hypothetical protein RSE12_16935 [Fuscovulum sp.]|nr:MAG: hypothetical protein RSE12_16935 [Fuscovulum sp.]